MKWPHVFGFLFFRFEGEITTSSVVADELPEAVHMGSPAGPARFAPRIVLSAPLRLRARETTDLKVAFALDAALRAAGQPTDLSDVQWPGLVPVVVGEEVLAGECLRRNAGDYAIFSVASAE